MTKKPILYMLKNLKYKRKLKVQVTARVVVVLPNRGAMPSKNFWRGQTANDVHVPGVWLYQNREVCRALGRERRSAEKEDILKFNEPYNQIIEDNICI